MAEEPAPLRECTVLFGWILVPDDMLALLTSLLSLVDLWDDRLRVKGCLQFLVVI